MVLHTRESPSSPSGPRVHSFARASSGLVYGHGRNAACALCWRQLVTRYQTKCSTVCGDLTTDERPPTGPSSGRTLADEVSLIVVIRPEMPASDDVPEHSRTLKPADRMPVGYKALMLRFFTA